MEDRRRLPGRGAVQQVHRETAATAAGLPRQAQDHPLQREQGTAGRRQRHGHQHYAQQEHRLVAGDGAPAQAEEQLGQPGRAEPDGRGGEEVAEEALEGEGHGAGGEHFRHSLPLQAELD